jgi:hypothetical protein
MRKGGLMSLTPEYGEEELLGRDEPGVRRSTPVRPEENGPEQELHEEEREKRDRRWMDAESNELRAPGQVCERCGQTITESQEVRRLPDGHFVHEVCPRPYPG